MAAPFNPEQLNKKDEEGHTRFGQYNSTKLYIVSVTQGGGGALKDWPMFLYNLYNAFNTDP